ncbi:MAG: hypothetical protein M1830_006263 [Pleopsidium flavum]|nr:MAG: hypothetical protein M1830_006263 [Pleopsidium flavum]
MGNEVLISVIFAVIAMAVGAAWLGGYLDAYQAKAQEKALDAMGENKASYGLKSNLKQTKITEDKDLNELQDNVADGLGSLVGKGGAGEGVGSGLSQGL